MIDKVHTFTIKRLSVTQDAMGGMVRTYTTAARGTLPTSVKGRACVVREKEKVEYGVRSERAVWKLLTDADPQVTELDQITFDYGDGVTRTLRVLISSYPRSANLAFYKTICDEDETTT